MVLLKYPVAVELSTWIGNLGCGHPISVSVFLSGTISYAVMKRPASSASAADAVTNLITCAMERTGPLGLGMGSFLDTKMCAPARLQALGLLR